LENVRQNKTNKTNKTNKQTKKKKKKKKGKGLPVMGNHWTNVIYVPLLGKKEN
jgi:hypothetical protein